MKPELLFGPSLLAPIWAQKDATWTPELSMQMQTIDDVIPSPDGKTVAYTQTRAVMETERSEMLTHIFLRRLDASIPTQLTQGEISATAPSFTPDGRFICFLSERSGQQNVWRVSVEGGEAERLTDWKGEIGTYRISPDGRWIAFAAAESMLDAEKARKEKRDLKIVGENLKRHGLWLVPMDPDASGQRRIKRLLDFQLHVVQVEWAPDSRFLAFECWPKPGADFWSKAQLSELELENGNLTQLTQASAAETSPRYSPDGRFLAFLRSSDPPHWSGDFRIVLLDRQDGTRRVLPATFDEFGRGGRLLGWSFDSSRLYFTETHGTQIGIRSMTLDGAAGIVYQPPRGTVSTNGVSVNLSGMRNHIGFSWESSEQPPEAFVLNLTTGEIIRVSQTNAHLPSLSLGETRRIQWKSKDGLMIGGLLTLPVAHETGKRYPLALIIHGGPMGVFTESFLGRPGIHPEAVFLARGYLILRCNIRGSSGYGKQFRRANSEDWGGKDYEDLMAGVDHVIFMGVAHPERMAVMGGSYGGYMTSWVIGHTGRFKAAIAMAPLTNLISFTGTTDIPSFSRDYFSGEVWEKPEAYGKHSPINYVKSVKTPTLIIHGEADERVPVSQGYEFHRVLERQGVATQMVVYPRAPHMPREPKFVLDMMQRHLAWVEKYVP